MYKKTITYKDYNDVERTETFYFNLSEAELHQMEFGVQGTYSAMIQKIMDTHDTPTLIKIFQDLIEQCYGVKSVDGRRFRKYDENGHRLFNEFKETEAYSILYMELATDAKAAADFVNGVLPSGLSEKYKDVPVLATNA